MDSAACAKGKLGAKALKEHGITSRSNGAVRDKIRSLEKAVKLARQLIAGKGHCSLEECSSQTKRNILRQCPHFEKLDRVFPRASKSETPRPPRVSIQSPHVNERGKMRVRVAPEGEDIWVTRSKSIHREPPGKTKAATKEETPTPEWTTPKSKPGRLDDIQIEEERVRMELGAERVAMLIDVKLAQAHARRQLQRAEVTREDAETIFPLKQFVFLW